MSKASAIQHNIEADALFQSIGLGAISTDQSGNISRINEAALKIIGKENQYLIGEWFPDVIVALDEEGKEILPLDRAITRAMMTGKSVNERIFYKQGSGKNISVHVTVSPIIVDAKPIGAVEVFRDISAEYEIDQLKSEFISIASHQLRTPATAVKNFIGLLREGFAGELTDEQKTLVEQAYASNEHQLDIVNNLLYVARADSKEVKLKLAETNLAMLVQDCISEQKQTLATRKQKITFSSPETMPMTCDRQFIHMLIENLLTNASKYTPDGGHVSVKLTDSGNNAILMVKDNGVGIAYEDQPRLFQRFTRIENNLSTVRGGSGIGLYLTKRIVDLHHGKIKVTSHIGKGSTFTVTLPKET